MQSNVAILFLVRWFSYRSARGILFLVRWFTCQSASVIREDLSRPSLNRWNIASNLSISVVGHIKTDIETQLRSEGSRIWSAVIWKHFHTHWNCSYKTAVHCSDWAKVVTIIPPVYNIIAISCTVADNFFPIAYRRPWHTIQPIDLAVTCELQNQCYTIIESNGMTSSTTKSLPVVSAEDVHHTIW